MVSRHLERQFSERLLERGENVVAVCCAPTKEGKPDDPLAEFALEKGLPLYQPESWKTPEALELMKSFDADVWRWHMFFFSCRKRCVMRQNMARFNIIRHYALRIVGRLQLTGLLRWARRGLVCRFSGLMTVWMKGQ